MMNFPAQKRKQLKKFNPKQTRLRLQLPPCTQVGEKVGEKATDGLWKTSKVHSHDAYLNIL